MINNVQTIYLHVLKAKMVFLTVLLVGSTSYSSKAQSNEDSLKIVEAINDYVFAIYEKDTSRIYKSVHPDLAKRGYSKRDGKMVESLMSFKRLVQIAATWRQSDRKLPDPQITIFDVLDYTASAKLIADWGIDYFHLSKISGEWKIYNVMWQIHPNK